MGSRKQDGMWNVWVHCRERQKGWRPPESSLTHSRPGCRARSSHILLFPYYAQSWLGSGMNEQIWLFLDFKAVHLVSFPMLFYWLYFRKIKKKKIYVFPFRKRFPKYVKHTGETDQEWVQVKRQGERNTLKEICNGLLSSKWSTRTY